MGYWIEGSVEGSVLLDFKVTFLVEGFLSPHHGEEHLLDILLYEGEGLREIDPDIPDVWLSEAGWKVGGVRLLREGPDPGDGEEYEADYEVVVEFEGVPVRFSQEDWGEKLSCINWGLGYSVPIRQIMRDVRADAPSSAKKVELTYAKAEVVFCGEGEDGEKIDNLRISSEVPLRGARW